MVGQYTWEELGNIEGSHSKGLLVAKVSNFELLILWFFARGSNFRKYAYIMQESVNWGYLRFGKWCYYQKLKITRIYLIIEVYKIWRKFMLGQWIIGGHLFNAGSERFYELKMQHIALEDFTTTQVFRTTNCDCHSTCWVQPLWDAL